jgi:hypothetical protein
MVKKTMNIPISDVPFLSHCFDDVVDEFLKFRSIFGHTSLRMRFLQKPHLLRANDGVALGYFQRELKTNQYKAR